MAKNRKVPSEHYAEALVSLRAKRTKRVSFGGDGLTELSALTIPDGVEITEEEASAAMFESFMPPDWQADLAGISEQCAEVLKHEGLSHPEWTVIREGEHAANVSPKFSDAWFAGRIAGLVHLIRLADQYGASADPLKLTRVLSLGYLLGDWELRRQIRKPATTGKKTLKRLDERRAQMNQAQKEAAEERTQLWQAQADAVWANRPALSSTAVAEIVKKELKSQMSVHTIRARIKKPDNPR